MVWLETQTCKKEVPVWGFTVPGLNRACLGPHAAKGERLSAPPTLTFAPPHPSPTTAHSKLQTERKGEALGLYLPSLH